MGKYDGLTEMLMYTGEEVGEITLKFDEIVKLIHSELPATAYKKGFWVNDRSFSKMQSMAWISAGWLVKSADIGDKQVTFKRDDKPRDEYFLQKD
ncbi:MAG: hypothetical protein Q7U53_17350 [Anaerolineaceae bacterium]|nr:hypothetical protein [Anaerolineaceae bacterium]